MSTKIAPLFLIMMLLMGVFSAVTATIGNAKAIIEADKGEILDRTIIVRNVNDVIVDIEIGASGDLKDYVKVIDEKFSLNPGEMKKARYKIEIGEGGTTITNLNVQFSPQDGSNGVGLSAELIVKAGGSNNLDRQDDINDDLGDSNSDNQDSSSDDSEDTGVSISFKNNPATGRVIGLKNVNKAVVFGSLSTLIVLIVLIGLVVYANKISKTKKEVKKGKVNENKKK
jgi:hypothetical protein